MTNGPEIKFKKRPSAARSLLATLLLRKLIEAYVWVRDWMRASSKIINQRSLEQFGRNFCRFSGKVNFFDRQFFQLSRTRREIAFVGEGQTAVGPAAPESARDWEWKLNGKALVAAWHTHKSINKPTFVALWSGFSFFGSKRVCSRLETSDRNCKNAVAAIETAFCEKVLCLRALFSSSLTYKTAMTTEFLQQSKKTNSQTPKTDRNTLRTSRAHGGSELAPQLSWHNYTRVSDILLY